jgi:hypothetical protein
MAKTFEILRAFPNMLIEIAFTDDDGVKIIRSLTIPDDLLDSAGVVDRTALSVYIMANWPEIDIIRHRKLGKASKQLAGLKGLKKINITSLDITTAKSSKHVKSK